MVTTTIDRSRDLATACSRFLDELEAWAEACIAELADAPPIDGHDQGTFTIAWAPLVERRGYRPALDFMKALRDGTAAHFADRGLWRHGYWRMADVHHGTEHFELFLATLWRLDPDDPETVRQMADAAEHLGNWVPDVPAWFDWDTGLFRSMHFGTDGVTDEPGGAVNLAPHLRCVTLCLLAHAMTGEQRYLDLARVHGGRWADAILVREELPVGLGERGTVYSLAGGSEAAYRRFAGQAPPLRETVDRAENFLASDAVNVFLALDERTAEPRFRRAAERLVDVLATELCDPDAGPAAQAIRGFRNHTGSERWDHDVLEAVSHLEPYGFRGLSLALPPPLDRRPSGIGKRADLPTWLEDGLPRRHNPILLGLAAELRRDERLATRAIDLARACFTLAVGALPSGRRHGCGARSVSAIARGHGRNNNAGVVTAVLAPLMDAFGLACDAG